MSCESVGEVFDRLLTDCVQNGGSDLHLTVDRPVAFRISGELKTVDGVCISKDDLQAIARHILSDSQWQLYEQDGQVDFGYTSELGYRFRANLYRSMNQPCLALRYLSDDFLSFSELGLPEYVQGLANLKDGLVLVTGATGSGKSTTLAALINHINRTQNRHIITIEDPVEFVYQAQKSIIHQRELVTDVSSFASAVRASLREDPDVILVGELRDRETVQAAISAAETGHLVFSTLHTNDAVGTVDRVVGFFPGEEQGIARSRFAMCLRSVISQKLIRLDHRNGRAAALEIMHVNKAVSNLIAMDRSKQLYSVIETSRAEGMQTMDQAFVELVKRGAISPYRAREMASNPQAVDKLLRLFA
ncbi:type IV pilus twitching motility protein PilT [Thiomicrorhabdus heinhorstiae]|uniref:PilT/PilU family type 4a pilus ATPase n=1 Tax=Thiomicrorhabdus heinhorstiae TaxID=2748010 RepID=A0ABS0BWC3_9GAMM|nr:PilT/PilU family type 4a pilus ATPase [Thiomicrorhabdus heinhorstiae]MBF6057383.1 PilT/PilU family type 4a pilus ATPase [Thiomicrorhabdus heinhorstiae]